jgi:hypothetical protein
MVLAFKVSTMSDNKPLFDVTEAAPVPLAGLGRWGRMTLGFGDSVFEFAGDGVLSDPVVLTFFTSEETVVDVLEIAVVVVTVVADWLPLVLLSRPFLVYSDTTCFTSLADTLTDSSTT